jgi:hypothetical protein
MEHLPSSDIKKICQRPQLHQRCNWAANGTAEGVEDVTPSKRFTTLSYKRDARAVSLSVLNCCKADVFPPPTHCETVRGGAAGTREGKLTLFYLIWNNSLSIVPKQGLIKKEAFFTTFNFRAKTFFPSNLLAIGLEPITLEEQILSLSCLPFSPSEPYIKNVSGVLTLSRFATPMEKVVLFKMLQHL